MTIDPSFAQKLSGLGQVLQNHLEAEQGPIEGNDMSVDTFVNSFEDEFPRDPDDPALGSYPTYSDEALRAAREQPYGLARGDRPKVWELNQPPPSRVSGWRVLDLYPNRETKNEFYRLAGTPAELRIMLQLIRHTQEIVKRFAAGGIVFEDWFKEWADGWDSFTSRTNAELNLSTNYPAVETAKTDPNSGQVTTIPRWRQPGTKPAYIEWKNATGGIPDGYRIIEYFPDRSQPFESVLFTGTDTEIANHIIRYHSSAQNQEDEADGWRKTLTPKTTGHPSVHFYFYKRDTSTNKKYFAEYSYILRDFVEFEGLSTAGERVISKADIRQLAARIEQQFLPNRNSPFVLQKGREIYTYQLFNKGYHMWVPARNQTAAVDLFTRILATRPDTFDDRWMRKSQAVNPSKVYPPTPPSVTVLNRPMQLDEKHPIVDVPFRYAWIELPCVGERHILVSLSTRKQRSPEIFID